MDSWGGHSGRADDYHYHVAPEHLKKVVGEGNPIGYALDGYPLYGKTKETLDKYLGRFNQAGTYQYHAADYPPYLIAGLRGVVQTDSPGNAPEDQIEPQPRSYPVRTKDYGPLNGAKITGLKKVAENSYSLEYAIGSKQLQVNYNWDEKRQYQFEYVDGDGKKTVETYQLNTQRNDRKQKSLADKSNGSKPPSNNQQSRKYCGDEICDNTESNQQCPVDCLNK